MSGLYTHGPKIVQIHDSYDRIVASMASLSLGLRVGCCGLYLPNNKRAMNAMNMKLLLHCKLFVVSKGFL
ncbi:hypothetical protein XELAEV_18032836mg [Xenopus laevis]|uniref:Uncharacterized protein n=1 Tax=Xenopus laevis TaxID=8355 RepID=A0A974CJ65_XENLA|nr:hypothetical protein XELAEV_18032836mg [Xenopus laevis]